MLSNTDVEALENELKDMRRNLIRRIQAKQSAQPAATTAGNSTYADRASDQMMREREAVMLTQSKEQLYQIEAALLRIKDDLYGKCMTCGGSISLSRLQALPYASHCIRCQSEQDRSSA